MSIEKTNSSKKIGYIILGTGILVEIILIYQGIFSWMITAWLNYPPDRFGIYIPILFFSLFVFRLYTNRDLKIVSSRSGMLIILGGAIIYLVGYLSDIHIIQAASLIVISFGMVLYLMGHEWAKKMLFAFSFLFLMLPTTSFLIESSFSVFLRSITADISCKILNSTGSACDTINCVLYLYNTELPVQYHRESISSLMMHLILTCIAAEFIFLKNRSKFLYVILLWMPCVIFAHSIIYITIGWSYSSGDINQSEVIWGCRKWLPAIIHILLLIVSWVLIKISIRRKNNDSK